MGFNPRLAPYSVVRVIPIRASSKMAATAQHFPLFKFPFAGQLVGAYANARKWTIDGSAKDAAVEATTNTGINQISLWKHATADTTATYATSLRAAIRTGANDTSSAAAPGINWRLPTVSAVAGLYTLTNKSATRRKFAAGDVCLVNISPYGGTDAHREYDVTIQADYIIGEEAS